MPVSGKCAVFLNVYFDFSIRGRPGLCIICTMISRLILHHLGSVAFGSFIILCVKLPRYILMYIKAKWVLQVHQHSLYHLFICTVHSCCLFTCTSTSVAVTLLSCAQVRWSADLYRQVLPQVLHLLSVVSGEMPQISQPERLRYRGCVLLAQTPVRVVLRCNLK